MTNTLSVIPIPAPVQTTGFALAKTILDAIALADQTLQTGDIVAVSSKYVAISQDRVVTLSDVVTTERATVIAARYQMDARLAQLIIDESDHIFGGIDMGFLLTHTAHGVISPNAGLDRSNIPEGQVVLLPSHPYAAADDLRNVLQAATETRLGVIFTDSWLMPGRLGTTGVAISAAGFQPLQDERGKPDLFGNPMRVTVRSLADALTACAQMVMGERAEATPIAIVRNADIQLSDAPIQPADVAIPWHQCIYVESLTGGQLPEELV